LREVCSVLRPVADLSWASLLATRIWLDLGYFVSAPKQMACATGFVSAGGSATWRDS
jgi:hypothetical protein